MTDRNNSGDATTTDAVAVIMAVYELDDPALFERSITSILQQDYTDGEVRIYLCIDGPIPERLEAVVGRYAAAVNTLVRNEKRSGLASSLNRLLGHLEDEQFVFRMDSDDYSLPSRISRQIAFMRKHAEVGISGTGVCEVDRASGDRRAVRYPAEHNAIFNQIAARNPLAHPTVCFRRSAIQQFDRYPETLINQDWALWFRCLEQGIRFANLDEILVEMTVSDSFFRRRGAARAAEEFGISARGIVRLHGVSWRLCYPVLRYLFRLAPTPLVRAAYRSRLR